MPLLRNIATIFLRVGNTTFGGGDPTIAVLEREFDRRGWLSPEQFTLAYGLARITPGTNVLAFCAGAAWMMAGMAGAILAVLAVTVPSAVLAVWITQLCAAGNSNRWAHAAIAGAISAAVGAMFAAALYLVRMQIDKGKAVSSVVIAAASFGLARFLPFSPIEVLAIAAVAGLVWTRP